MRPSVLAIGLLITAAIAVCAGQTGAYAASRDPAKLEVDSTAANSEHHGAQTSDSLVQAASKLSMASPDTAQSMGEKVIERVVEIGERTAPLTTRIAIGMASYYASRFHGRRTASGSTYDETRMTAAHPTLPFGTRLKVTNLANLKSVTVRVTDRGPYLRGRIVDLSRSAARKIGMLDRGVAKVSVEKLENVEE